MKKVYKIILLLLTSSFLFTAKVFAERTAPAIISPVIYNDIRIVTENDPQSMGVVQAFNTKTNTLMWKKKVYKVKFNPFVEEDTQLVFIKEMKIDSNMLIVINESGKVYTLDPNTGRDLNKTNSTIVIIIPVIVILSLVLIRMKKKIS